MSIGKQRALTLSEDKDAANANANATTTGQVHFTCRNILYRERGGRLLMRLPMKLLMDGRLSACLLLLCSMALAATAHAGASLEIAEFSKPGEKKTLPLSSEEPMLFNIEFFSGWSHCEVAAGTHASTKQSHAWMRCFGTDDTQIAMICQGNEKQTVVLGHKDNNPKRGSLSLICRSE